MVIDGIAGDWRGSLAPEMAGLPYCSCRCRGPLAIDWLSSLAFDDVTHWHGMAWLIGWRWLGSLVGEIVASWLELV